MHISFIYILYQIGANVKRKINASSMMYVLVGEKDIRKGPVSNFSALRKSWLNVFDRLLKKFPCGIY